MSFKLKNVVPWGRTFEEYIKMFSLADNDLKKNIIGFGDGPASFNATMRKNGVIVTSCDPLYSFSKDEISLRITETKDKVIEQTKSNMNNFIWQNIKTIQELETIRMDAMNKFLSDYDKGKSEGRYLAYSLPDIPLEDNKFDLGLSSHFLFLYSSLGFNFHLKSINEMLRLCNEIRIFPLLDLDAKKSKILKPIINKLSTKGINTEIKKVDYEFQIDGNEALFIYK